MTVPLTASRVNITRVCIGQVRVVDPDPVALEAGTKSLEASGGTGEGDSSTAGAGAGPRPDVVAQNTATNNVVWTRTIPKQGKIVINFKYVFEYPTGVSIVVS